MQEATVKVWDPLVRIGHWGLALAFLVAYLSEGEPEWLHSFAGYTIAAYLAVRLVWGFIGPKHARFSSFLFSPRKVIAYLRDLPRGKSERHLGHSPAGGAMVIALMLSLGGTAFSGMALLAAEEGEGPLAGYIAQTDTLGAAQTAPVVRYEGNDEHHEGRGDDSVWEDVHEVFANLTLLLVLLHLAGVAMASIAHNENLPRSMVTGRKRA
ncbi:cytochrome b/b6 domain-containing protein [Thioclava sp. A2]|uniref:cytochrome b/b6 domain-containing protein n=1 Tax=Thioclava sp. FCG-A2 TaxID=3080562 RepID=UPI002954C005|nr:cytochrome b/b6 domain-containing protein [Thioclava sp. A2]MDV7271056.1 cytochrome b/b6 domain-containing protein [Thioclava sp. A2]